MEKNLVRFLLGQNHCGKCKLGLLKEAIPMWEDFVKLVVESFNVADKRAKIVWFMSSFLNIMFYRFILFMCMSVYMHMPAEARKGYESPWRYSYSGL